MINNTSKISQLDLTESELEMILEAIAAYQHHAAYRDLHGKVAVLSRAAGGVSQVAMSATLRARSARFTAVMV